MNVNELLQRFHTIATSPKAQMDAYLAQGKKVVLTAPVYTPEEIIHAMGPIPMGAWGADVELKEAKRYFPAFICSIAQSIVELGMNGAYDGASAIVIPSLCDSLKVLGQNFKYAVPSIPMIPMTYPQNRKPAYAADFTKAGYERIISDLTATTGASFTDEALAESIKVYNAHNASMRHFADVAAQHPELSASARSDVFKSAWFMEKSEHTVLVTELCDALEAQPSDADGIPIMLSGILADSSSFNEILDQFGLYIVADDIAAQSRQYRTDASETAPALDALCAKFAAMDQCSVLYDPAKTRCEFIAETAAEAGAKGVLLVLTKFCDPEEFDIPLIQRACDAKGLATTVLEIDRQMVNYEQARTIVETFRDVLI